MIEKAVNVEQTENSLSKKAALICIILMIFTAIASTLTYTNGSNYLVERTLYGSYLLLGGLLVGALIGYPLMKIYDTSSFGSTKHYLFPKFIGSWAYTCSIFLGSLMIFSLNERLGKNSLHAAMAVVERKYQPMLAIDFLLEVKSLGMTRTIPVEQSVFESYAVGDSMQLKVVQGYFGRDVLQPPRRTDRIMLNK